MSGAATEGRDTMGRATGRLDAGRGDRKSRHCAASLSDRLRTDHAPVHRLFSHDDYHARVKNRLLPFLLLVLGALHAAPALADYESIRREVQSGTLQPLAKILDDIQKRHPSRVIDVELERNGDGLRWYEVKLQTADGRRMEIYVDAETGREIRKPDAQDNILPMANVIRSLLQVHPGQVLNGELELAPGGAPYYVFHVLNPEGREALLRADARSGRLLGTPTVELGKASGFVALAPLLEQLEKRFSARVTEVELKVRRDQTHYYEVELQLDNMRSLELHVDARSGRLIDDDGKR